MNAALAATLARGGLAASGLRLALTLASVALGVALAGAVHTVHTSALAEIDRATRTLSGAADLEIRGPRNGFDDASFLRVAARPEVDAASPVIEIEAPLADGSGSVRLVGLDPLRAVRLQPAFVSGAHATGSPRVARLLDPGTAWVSPALAARASLGAGSMLRVVAANGVREYRVGDVLGRLGNGGEMAVIDIAAAQEHFGRVGQLSRIDLKLRAGVDEAAFRAALSTLLPPGVVVSPAASASGRAAVISRAYRVNLDALALVALATGAFLVFSTLALQAARRRQEFALLRALGVTRRGLMGLLALEGGMVGAIGAAIGTVLALAASRALLERTGADLGAGFFGGSGAAFAPDALALAGIALLAVVLSAAAALSVARAVARIPVADALRDRSVDLPHGGGSAKWATLLALAGIPLLFAPPVGELPLAGYAAIACWLAAAVAAVGPACRALLSRLAPLRDAVAMLALAQVRHLPGHLAASVAGIVVSASLCVAMAIMVHSFRASVEEWLHGVVGADLYASTSAAGDAAYLDAAQVDRVRSLPMVRAVETLRFDRLVIGDGAVPLTLVARPIDARILAGFRAQPAPPPADADGAVPIWISEAARDLQGWRPGQRVKLPIAGQRIEARVAGTIRDYARTWGAVLIPIEHYRRITRDDRTNDLAIHLVAGADATAAMGAVREALAAPAVHLEDASGIRERSLRIFDRSFAVTYALEAIAVVIGLAGVTSSFAALAWSRRREFGLLRFIGLTRRDVLRMLWLEGAAAGSLGAALGLASGIAISFVLVHVVNRQSFHWSIEVHWPVGALVALVGAVIATCGLGARISGAMAVRHEAVLAVKEDA